MLRALKQETPASEWSLSHKETACLNNCARSYMELKDFLGEQLLRDYSYIRDKNRQKFEDF